VLPPTAAEWMIDGVHGHASDYRPLLGLGLELEEALAGLDQGLVETATASYHSDSRHALWREPFHLAAGQLHYGLANVMGYENGADA
jgi:hypothetical protein